MMMMGPKSADFLHVQEEKRRSIEFRTVAPASRRETYLIIAARLTLVESEDLLIESC